MRKNKFNVGDRITILPYDEMVVQYNKYYIGWIPPITNGEIKQRIDDDFTKWFGKTITVTEVAQNYKLPNSIYYWAKETNSFWYEFQVMSTIEKLRLLK